MRWSRFLSMARARLKQRFAVQRAWAIVLPALLLCLPVPQASAAADLAPLLAAPGTTVTLNGGTVYSSIEVALTVDKTILCNGATIQSTGGPIRASAPGVTLTVDNCVIQGTGWALLGALNGARLVVRNNTHLTGNGANSGVYVAGSTLDLTGGSINQCQWGVNMENSDASLHGVSIANVVYGIQNVAGSVTLDSNSQLRNVNANNPGVGVSLIASATYPSRRASAVIRDSTFTGFGNAVDIQPTAAKGLPAGTVEITGSTFNAQYWSALAAVDADNLRFASNRVSDAITDGVFLVNSTGVIERSEILNSLNTGVTFWGCPNGATLRNSLVSGSAHQGVAIVADSVNDRVSHNVQILDNTFKGNAIADVLVDGLSDALIQGNVLTRSSGVSVRFHGSPSAHLIADLLYKANTGLEMKDSAYASGALSLFARHDSYGALLYANAVASFSHSAFQTNGVVTGNHSVFVNTGAQVTLQRSSIGPAGAPGFYNNAGNTVTASNDYWGNSTGPLLPHGGGGSGAILDWNASNGSGVGYQPFLTAPPLDTRINDTFNLSAGATTLWPTGVGLSMRLTGAPSITGVPNGLAAALRLLDTSTLTMPFPPTGTFADGVIAVWAEYDLLSRAQSGSLRFQTVGYGPTARLSRLQPDRCWAPMSTSWDSSAGEVVFSPSDLRTLTGVFALGPALPDQETSARQLITSYYSDILGRAPETGAVDAWYTGYFQYSVSLGVDVRFVFREMARVFFSSPEYQARGRTNEQFIRDAYQVFLHRAPSPSELNGWLQGTWNRPQVVSLFAESAEFGGYLQGLFTCHEGIPTRNFVTTMYIGLLDRLVDAGGLAYYETVFDTAFGAGGIEGVRATARDVGVQIMASTEYRSTNPTNETHVVRLYRAYLGRFPSTDELTYWQGQLDAHLLTLTALINTFSSAPEFTSRLNTFFGPH
jgi:hypothetical protein